MESILIGIAVLFTLLVWLLGIVRMYEFSENSCWGGCGGIFVLTFITAGIAPIFFGFGALIEMASNASEKR